MIQRFKTQAIAYVCVGRPVYFLLAVKFFCKSDREHVEGFEGGEGFEEEEKKKKMKVEVEVEVEMQVEIGVEMEVEVELD